MAEIKNDCEKQISIGTMKQRVQAESSWAYCDKKSIAAPRKQTEAIATDSKTL